MCAYQNGSVTTGKKVIQLNNHMKPELLEMYIDVACMLEDLKDPSYEQISEAIKLHHGIEVTVSEIEEFYLPETQEKLAQIRFLGINY